MVIASVSSLFIVSIFPNWFLSALVVCTLVSLAMLDDLGAWMQMNFVFKKLVLYFLAQRY